MKDLTKFIDATVVLDGEFPLEQGDYRFRADKEAASMKLLDLFYKGACATAIFLGIYFLLSTFIIDWIFFEFVGIDSISIEVALQDPNLWIGTILVCASVFGIARIRKKP